MLIGRGDGLSNLCHVYGFNHQQRVLKTFSGPDCFHSKNGIVQLLHLLGNLYVFSSLFHLAWTLVLIETDGILSAMCPVCRFDCQGKVLETFPGPGYLRS